MSGDNMPRKISATSVDAQLGTKAYFPEHRAICDGRIKRTLGNAFGLTQFGVNLTILEPGAASAQRHWHGQEDEFIYVTEGAITLIDDDGELVLNVGDCAGFPAGREIGHMLVNKSGKSAAYVEIGARAQSDTIHYPDLDLHGVQSGGEYRFTRKDGSTPND